MANYYHEARAEKRAIKEKTEANKRKAERRAELAGVEVGNWMRKPRFMIRSPAAPDIARCRLTGACVNALRLNSRSICCVSTADPASCFGMRSSGRQWRAWRACCHGTAKTTT